MFNQLIAEKVGAPANRRGARGFRQRLPRGFEGLADDPNYPANDPFGIYTPKPKYPKSDPLGVYTPPPQYPASDPFGIYTNAGGTAAQQAIDNVNAIMASGRSAQDAIAYINEVMRYGTIGADASLNFPDGSVINADDNWLFREVITPIFNASSAAAGAVDSAGRAIVGAAPAAGLGFLAGSATTGLLIAGGAVLVLILIAKK